MDTLADPVMLVYELICAVFSHYTEILAIMDLIIRLSYDRIMG